MTDTKSDGSMGLRAIRGAARAALPLSVFAGALLLYVCVIVPYQRTLWIIQQVEERADWSSFIKCDAGGPEWLRAIFNDHWMQGFSHITELELTAKGERFDTQRLLGYLSPHSRVEHLALNCPEAYDEVFGDLSCLPSLKTLRLQNGALTDNGMRHLRRCTSLTTLQLIEMTVTDGGIEPLRSLTRLKELHIRKCRGVTDESLRYIRHASGITKLRLSGAAFTDACIQDLSEMKQLTMLDVFDTGITTQGATRLVELLPECSVVWSENLHMHSNKLVYLLGQ
jgi:hypothetical protein